MRIELDVSRGSAGTGRGFNDDWQSLEDGKAMHLARPAELFELAMSSSDGLVELMASRDDELARQRAELLAAERDLWLRRASLLNAWLESKETEFNELPVLVERTKARMRARCCAE